MTPHLTRVLATRREDLHQSESAAASDMTPHLMWVLASRREDLHQSDIIQAQTEATKREENEDRVQVHVTAWGGRSFPLRPPRLIQHEGMFPPGPCAGLNSPRRSRPAL
ncbi:hypothetical protein GDO81_027616 [Engystomops pustulosus]|uniref:Uncharacterized protein n=1 Tax=Engystomops pustulosus TaxID=76066 RepID=A0AAV6YPA9_ENGPU|nr:hypothetical protein GDO81_027616 [Engystomops pustulosus]